MRSSRRLWVRSSRRLWVRLVLALRARGLGAAPVTLLALAPLHALLAWMLVGVAGALAAVAGLLLVAGFFLVSVVAVTVTDRHAPAFVLPAAVGRTSSRWPPWSAC